MCEIFKMLHVVHYVLLANNNVDNIHLTTTIMFVFGCSN